MHEPTKYDHFPKDRDAEGNLRPNGNEVAIYIDGHWQYLSTRSALDAVELHEILYDNGYITVIDGAIRSNISDKDY